MGNVMAESNSGAASLCRRSLQADGGPSSQRNEKSVCSKAGLQKQLIVCPLIKHIRSVRQNKSVHQTCNFPV